MQPSAQSAVSQISLGPQGEARRIDSCKDNTVLSHMGVQLTEEAVSRGTCRCTLILGLIAGVSRVPQTTSSKKAAVPHTLGSCCSVFAGHLTAPTLRMCKHSGVPSHLCQ